MDSSQLTRLRQEAANQYLSRNKTVDSSLLTFKKHQAASYAGAARFKTSPYYNGTPTVNPIVNDTCSCPKNHSFTNGYTSATREAQQESIALAKGGAAICCDQDYSTGPPGIMLLNPSTCSTILTSYNNNTPAPGQWKAYGYGVAHYFPKSDLNSQSTCCTPNKYPHPSA
jgi:hypothetical protein